MSDRNRELAPWEIAARRRNAQKSTGPRTREGKRRAALNSIKWPRWSPPVRAALAKEHVPPPECRQLTRKVIALLAPSDEHTTRLVNYLTHNWWVKAITVGTMQRQIKARLDTSRIDRTLEEDLLALAMALSYWSRKWRYRLEKNLGEPFESLADLRAKIEARLPILKDCQGTTPSESANERDRSRESDAEIRDPLFRR
jgi:hypothetical protein